MKLSQVVSDGPWEINQSTAGIAVDDNGRVYVADTDNVYAVDNAQVSVFLTPEDAAAITGGPVLLYTYADLDIGSDGLLYILTQDWLIQTNTAHGGVALRDLKTIVAPAHLGVASPVLAGLINHYDGLWTVGPSGNEMVYDDTQVLGGTNCATEDLAVQSSGVFLYQPGCNGSPIVRGKLDGSGAVVLFDEQPNTLNVHNFLCVARDPAGGFFVMAEDDDTGDSTLLHFGEDVSETNGATRVLSAPTFAQAAETQDETLLFRYCAMAAGKDGTVWIQSFKQLWRLSPL